MNKRNIKAFFKMTLIFTLIFSVISSMFIYIRLDLMDDGKLFGQSELLGVNLTQLFGMEDKVVDRKINVLLVGVDKDGTRSDVMLLGNLDMDNQMITLLQIPRDTYVPNNGRYDKKINSAYGAGKEKMIKEVEGLTGAKIDKFVKIDTSQFREIIDTIGGVYYDVPINMNYDDPVQDLHIHLNKGYQLLDGDKAEQFVRFRQNNNGSGYARGDIERLEAQQGFIKEAISQLVSFKNTLQIPKMVSIFIKMVETDFENNELIAYMSNVIKIPMENIEIVTMPGEPKYIGGGSYYVPYSGELKELITLNFDNE